MKKFICYIPLQPKLKYVSYAAVDNQQLHYGNSGETAAETAFPMMPVINGYIQAGEEIEILAFVNDYENSRKNYEVFAAEAEALCKTKGVRLRNGAVTKIIVPYEDGIDALLTAFGQMIDHLEDDDEIYACITYGTKPSAMVELMALRYIRQVKKNTYIACVAYGGLDHLSNEARIYDVTALVQLDDIIRVMAQSGVENPREAIRRILEF